MVQERKGKERREVKMMDAELQIRKSLLVKYESMKAGLEVAKQNNSTQPTKTIENMVLDGQISLLKMFISDLQRKGK